MKSRIKSAANKAGKKRAVFKTGDVVGGHYVIEEPLDEGGMAIVFRATNAATGKACALKILHAQLGDRPEFVALFAKEAKVTSVIGDNEHIVNVFDAGLDEERGIPFIVMELLEGETLEEVLAHGPLAPALARLCLEQLSEALDQAHQAGVVHRDLKPSNLFISDRDGEPWLKVMDFGIAKVLEGEAVRTATHIGTPAYNAPEQMGATTRKLAAKQGITIASGVSPATDVWAMGLLAYEMFTGDVPGEYWGVETLSELPMKVAFEELVAPSERAGANAALLPAGFDAWFGTCLKKNAAERFATAGEAITALLELIEHDVIDLDAAADARTRLKSSPVLAADKAKTRVKTGGESVSEPPPLPRVSSPAITVAKGPAGLSKNRDAVSSAPPVVKSDTRHAPQHGQSRWGMAAGVSFLALAAVGAIVWNGQTKQAGAIDACEGNNKSPQACLSACDAGNMSSCAVLAEMHVTGVGVDKDEAKALSLLQKACGVSTLDAGAVSQWTKDVETAGCADETCVASACSTLADMHTDGKGGALKNSRAATALYKRVCRVGMDDDNPRGSHGCVGLGEQRQLAGQTEAARNYYAAACEDGLPTGCVRLASVLEKGNGEWKDEKRARELYEKACEGGHLEGCTRLGHMVEFGLGGWVKDDNKAVELYDRACDGGQMLGCVHLANAVIAGKGGLTPDAVRAVELYQRACDGEEMRACANLALMNERGEGGLSKDEKHAFTLNQRACKGGALRGCAQLGDMYLQGKAGLTKDVEEGRSLISRACKGGEGQACVSLAGMLQKSADDADQKRAVELYEAACKAGQKRACTELANMVYSGRGGLERDAERSAALNVEACEGGDVIGCQRLGLLYAMGHGVEQDLERASQLHTKGCGGTLDDTQTKRCASLKQRTEATAED